MSWSFYLSLIAFFTIVFGVFYAIAYSVLRGVRDNYRRYYQKADLQWTDPGRRAVRRVPRLSILVALSAGTAWAVVHFLIQP